MKYLLALAVLVFFTSGCTSTPQKITGGEAAPLAAVAANPTIRDDLIAAAGNLHQAVAVGALAADDPAVGCIDNVLVDVGITTAPGTTPAASFTPENKGVASAGAIAYILARQAEALIAKGAQFKASVSCKAVIGQIVIDGAKVAREGVRTISPLRLLP